MAKILIEVDDKASKPLSKIDKEAQNVDKSLEGASKEAKKTTVSLKAMGIAATAVGAAMTSAVVRTANLEKAMFGLTEETKDWITQSSIQYGQTKEMIAGYVQTAKVAGLASKEIETMIDMSVALGRAMPHESMETIVDDLTEFYDTGVEAGIVTRILEGRLGEAELKAASFADKMEILKERAEGVNKEFDKTMGANIDKGMKEITNEVDILADAFTDLAKQAGLFTAIDWAKSLAAKAIRVIAREVKGLQLAFAEIGYWYQNFMHGADLQQWLALAKTRQEYRRLSQDPDPVGVNEGSGDGGRPPEVRDTSEVDKANKKILEMNEQFWDDYNRTNMTEMEYDLHLLGEQYAEYDKYVKDKVALEEWFNSEVRRIQEENVTYIGDALDTVGIGISNMYRDMMDGAIEWKEAFGDIIKDILAQLFEVLVVKQAVSAIGGAFGIATNAQGNAFNNGMITPFASGGVVTSPTVFPMANGIGLMGEAGAEAVMPLTRMPNGNLGVESTGAKVTVNNYSNSDVDVQQNKAGEIDIVISKVVDSINRGGVVGNAISSRYGVKRV